MSRKGHDNDMKFAFSTDLFSLREIANSFLSGFSQSGQVVLPWPEISYNYHPSKSSQFQFSEVEGGTSEVPPSTSETQFLF